MKTKILLTTYYLLLISILCPAQVSNSSITKKAVNLHNGGFMQNKGQIVDQNYKPNPNVKYLLCSPGFNVQLRQTGFSYDTYTEAPPSPPVGGNKEQFVKKHSLIPPHEGLRGAVHYHRVDIELTGCNPHTQLIAKGKSKAYYNYFTAGTAKGGVSNVHSYQKVIYKNIYPNIDLVASLNLSKGEMSTSTKDSRAGFEYFFVVHPGGNPSDIKIQYKGANSVKLENNKLVINVTAGNFYENIPSSYLQDPFSGAREAAVQVNYASLGNNTFGFSLPKFPPQGGQRGAALIIDPTPTLDWGTYYGGTGDDEGYYGIALDADDDVYVTGYTNSSTAIATTGAWQTTIGGGYDTFVAKFNPTGSSLLWGTYYGGTGDDEGLSIALDASDNIYITGETSSTNAIATAGAWQTSFGGGYDAFVAKFNSTGSSLLWGTYYGGTGDEDGYGYGDIAVDASGNVYITGYTASTNAIATAGAWQTSFGGTDDAFVAKFNPTGSSLLWGTYYGGAGDDEGLSIALDTSDNVYITGYTESNTAIATAGAWQTSYTGNYDAFVAKFNSTGSSLLWGTYYGGTGFDEGYGIALDASANVYITGYTHSPNKIATAGAWKTNNGGSYDAFVAKFNPAGSSLLWGTYYGGTGDEAGLGIALDASTDVYITGYTNSTNAIATAGAWQTSFGGNYDAFVAKFNPTGSSLLWGTYYGGAGDEDGNAYGGIALDASANVYITGYTTSTNAIATAGAWQTSFGGSYDAFIAKFDSTAICSSMSLSTSITKNSICIGDSTTISVIPVGSSTIKYFWSPGGQTNQTIHVTPASTTTYTVTVNDTIAGCYKTDSAKITVNPLPIATLSGDTSVCPGTYTTLNASGGSAYSWSNGATTSGISGLTAGTYSVTVTDSYGCTATAAATVNNTRSIHVTINPDITINNGDSTTLSATGGETYFWSPSTGLSCDTCSNPIAKPGNTTTYCVLADSSGCKDSACETITVEFPCENIAVPTAFSPNGDGHNDFECVHGSCIKTLDFVIYDRWGNKVFETNDPKQCWDGTYRGKPINSGVFDYYLKATLNNGNPVTQKGNITLIR